MPWMNMYVKAIGVDYAYVCICRLPLSNIRGNKSYLMFQMDVPSYISQQQQ